MYIDFIFFIVSLNSLLLDPWALLKAHPSIPGWTLLSQCCHPQGMESSPCSSCVHFPWTSLPQPDTTEECDERARGNGGRASARPGCSLFPKPSLSSARGSTTKHTGKFASKPMEWFGLEHPNTTSPAESRDTSTTRLLQAGLEHLQGWGISQKAFMEQSHSLSSSSIPAGAAWSQHSQSVLTTSHCRIYTNLNTHGMRKRKNPWSCALDRRLLDGS